MTKMLLKTDFKKTIFFIKKVRKNKSLYKSPNRTWEWSLDSPLAFTAKRS